MRWFVRGDVDGFFGLALDNLVQLLLIDSLCRTVLGFPDELVTGRILPGAAVSLLVGNLFYAWQAKRLADRTGRSDVCALPYGINTVSLIAHVFLVMLPAKVAAQNAGQSPAEVAETAWRLGLVACLGSGVIELIGTVLAGTLRRWTPRAALLSTLAGIAVTFISMTFLLRTFARPAIGLTTLGIILVTYFGRVRFRGGLPGGLVAVAVGTLLAWLTGIAPATDWKPLPPHFAPPVWSGGDLFAALGRAAGWVQFVPVIVPMGLFNLLGSLQNIESAEAAGDPYPTAPSLTVNGLGSVIAALFGSCFPTTIYIGHPGWKALGARAGYSALNGLFFTVICLGGMLTAIAWAVPVDAGMAIVLYIGIVISAQAFQATPPAHAPAVVVGLLPGLAAWGALMVKTALRVVGYGSPDRPFSKVQELVPAFQRQDTWIDGAFALSEGFIFTAMILSAAVVGVIERRWVTAAVWTYAAAALSAVGLMHAYHYTDGDTALALGTAAWPWAVGYLAMGTCFLAARWLTVPNEEGPCG
jgi:AGZA family xanthine/uracil permease-like MFS transporter